MEKSLQVNLKLPSCLNIENASNMVPYLSIVPGGEWAMFCDDEDRVIAQQMDLVFSKYEIDKDYEDDDLHSSVTYNNEDSENTEDSERKTISDKYLTNNVVKPEAVLLVSITSEDDEEIWNPHGNYMFPNELETCLKTRTCIDHQQYDSSCQDYEESACNKDSLIKLSPKNLMPHSPNKCKLNLLGFPCVNENWYLNKPSVEGILVDEFSVINTTALADDMRKFLKYLAIPLKKFSQNHLNRTQGTLSDLLNHPKEWKNLSFRGKQTYVKMMQFLSAHNLEELVLEISNFQKECPTMKRLPANIQNALTSGKMPLQQEISSASEALLLNSTYLKNHCVAQVKQFTEQESPAIEEGAPQPETPNNDHENLTKNSSAQGINKADSGTQTTTSSSDLREKVKEKQPKVLERHICTFFGCGAILKTKASFNEHLTYHSGIRPCRCPVCNKSFGTQHNLKSHLRVHLGSSKQPNRISKRATERMMTKACENGEFYKSLSVMKHKRETLRQMKYICGVCWEGFKTRQRLCKHLLLHHKVSQRNLRNGFTCYICAKRTRNISSLVVHMRAHTNNRPFECDQCKMGFHTKANLRRHKRTHTGEKLYSCSICHAKFTEQKSVAVHLRTHTGEKPFTCTTCNKSFSQRSPLQVHMLIHQNEKPHLCEVCGLSFRQRTNLQMHVKRHRGLKKLKCSDCEQSFLTKSDFMRHSLKHSGHRPYKCDLCNRRFTRLAYLRDHSRKQQHSSAPKCPYCDKIFCDDIIKRKHIMKEHSSSSDDAMAIKIQSPAVLDVPPGIVLNEPVGTSDSNSCNTTYVTTRALFNNQKHFIITAVHSLENAVTVKCVGDDDGESILLTPSQNDLSAPFTSSAHSVILQGMNISNRQLGSTGQSVTGIMPHHTILLTNVLNATQSVQERLPAMAIEAGDTEMVTSSNNISLFEDGDPNMQSVVVESTEDNMVISQDQIVANESNKLLKLNEAINSYQVILPASHNENNIMINMDGDHHMDIRNNEESSLISNSMNENESHFQTKEDIGEIKAQTYIVVDLEIE